MAYLPREAAFEVDVDEAKQLTETLSPPISILVWLGQILRHAHLHADGVVGLGLAPLPMLPLVLLLLQLLVPCACLQRPYQPPPIQLPAAQTTLRRSQSV